MIQLTVRETGSKCRGGFIVGRASGIPKRSARCSSGQTDRRNANGGNGDGVVSQVWGRSLRDPRHWTLESLHSDYLPALKIIIQITETVLNQYFYSLPRKRSLYKKYNMHQEEEKEP